MKILLAPDKFKGSLTAQEVGRAIAAGILSVKPAAEIDIHPIADGGDGSLDVLKEVLDLEASKVSTQDPLGRSITTSYYLATAKKHSYFEVSALKSAFIEVASASGLVLLAPTERNPLRTSTYGTGLMVRDAIERGAKRIYLFLGGSATNDLGLGIAAALGYQFYAGKELIERPTGQDLLHLTAYLKPEDFPGDVQFILLCDVKNPLYGPTGAAHVYAAQKGASAADIVALERGLQSSSQLIEKQSRRAISTLEGGGAAGGIAAGLHALFEAEIKPGFTMISELTGLEKAIQKADVIITGEGHLDGQSLSGKVIDGVARLCKKHRKPLHVFAGGAKVSKRELIQLNIHSLQTVTGLATDLNDAMGRAAFYLNNIGKNWANQHL